MFEICLAVEVFSFYIAWAIGIGAFEEYKVSRKEAVAPYLDYLAHLNFGPIAMFEFMNVGISYHHLSLILNIILLMSLSIFKYVFDSWDTHDKHKRKQDSRLIISDGDLRNYL